METAELHEVRIHIDQEPHHSPNPTTGSALYALGKVQQGMELFGEVTGDREDPEVPNGPETIHLKEDEHFHSGLPKVYTIIVNGRKKEISNREGTLTEGETVRIKDGMIFDVSETNKS